MSSPISAEIPIIPGEVTARRRVTAEAAFVDVAVDVDIDVNVSFEVFYATHRDALARAVAVTLGDVDLAADSTDEAMIRAYQSWATVGALDRPAGWVFRVAVNHGRSRRRRVARKLRYTGVLDRDRHEDVPFAAALGDDSLVGAVRELDHDQRAVVVLRVLLEFSERECADALGIRPGTAKSRLHRGLARIRAAVPHLAPDIDAVAAEPDPADTAQHRPND